MTTKWSHLLRGDDVRKRKMVQEISNRAQLVGGCQSSTENGEFEQTTHRSNHRQTREFVAWELQWLKVGLRMRGDVNIPR